MSSDPGDGRFAPVGSTMPYLALEQRQRDFWQDQRIFERSIDERPADKLYTFYEGPPTANGAPGVHHVLSRVYKDLFPRYKTMRGYRAPRKAGWDTHGLPVELEVERELGLSTKAQIEQFGIVEFNRRCRESVMRYVSQWRDMTERIAFWVDMDDAYVTFHADYVESAWWIFKSLWDGGLIYEARRVTPHCPRCETSLSSHELSLGYQDDTPDPSVAVKFRLLPEALPAAWPEDLASFAGDTFLVAWTTTPWTLPGNTALAVAPGETYAVVETPRPDGNGGERLILAQARLEGKEAGLDAPSVVRTLPGSALVGLRYEGLYEPGAWGDDVLRFNRGRLESTSDAPARRVLAGDFVSMDDGTGIVHIAPAFGEEDYGLGRANDLVFLQPVNLQGRFIGQAPDGGPFAGLFVKDADVPIMEDLHARGLLLSRGTIRHTYPFCWRCDTPLLYYAKPSWYIATTAVAESMTRGNRELMHWYPEHVRDGRYGDWLANNVDWAISRERFWGTPLPFWRCDSCNATEAVGSFAELAERSGTPPIEDPHRPFVDEITFPCRACNGASDSEPAAGVMHRIPEVADAWFDSGAMPYAQWHYPFENQDVFRERFPADFICEAVDQTRGWFYSLHAEAALLHHVQAVPEPISYRHVISLGHILDEQGAKMSKSKGNVVDPWTVLDEHGADALRWYLFTASPTGSPRRFSSNLVGEAQRRFLLTLWNTYSFFVTYATIDGFDPASQPPAERAELDDWVRGALQGLIGDVTEALEGYDPTTAGRAIEAFVDELSNWYVRRSRRRFWKSDDDQDKAAAYHTLYECLVTLSKLLAPFTPYVAEEMYRNLVRGLDGGGDADGTADSVHLAAWPLADASRIDTERSEAMRLVQRLASLGRAARSKAGVKVRQPLAAVMLGVRSAEERGAVERYAPMLLDELNVKAIEFVDGSGEGAEQLVKYVIKPNLPILGPRLGKDVGALRRAMQELDPAVATGIAHAAEAGESIEIGGFELAPSDLLIEMREREGAATAQDAQYTVAVTTELTAGLRREGAARELVHRLQTLRREAGFEIADRIVVWLDGDAPDLLAAVEAHQDYVQGETLALELRHEPPPDDAAISEETVEGESVRLGVRRAAAAGAETSGA